MNPSPKSPETLTDPAALRFNQACIVVLSTLSLFGAPWLVAFVAAVMLVGTFTKAALFKGLFVGVVRPIFGFERELAEDDPRAHLFAQGVGGTVLTLATFSYLVGLPLLGMLLTLLVIALAALNLTTGYCVGCQLYFRYKMFKYRLSHG